MLGYSRQNYYKQSRFDLQKDQIKAEINKLILDKRKLLPRLGTRKLYKLIKPDFGERAIKCGRDKLFAIIGESDLLIKPRKLYIITTNSKHWMKKYPNQIKDIIIDKPETVWVSDITYIKTEEGNCYLSMITDAYSRKIMGYNVSDSMDATEIIKSLQMALSNRKYLGNTLIHHSDRGLQYCSYEYIKLAKENNITMSMTENSDPYENALAERMNRTIKEEFCLDRTMKNRQQVYDTIKEAVKLYNGLRPHLSLNYFTPDFAHIKKTGNWETRSF